MKIKYIMLIIAIFGIVGCGIIAYQSTLTPQTHSLTFETLELADTDEERRTGLMNRTDLCADCGMLFDFGATQSVSFWMKNTPTSLDILMIDKDGKIDIIHKNTIPNSTTSSYQSTSTVQYVLEVPAGYSNTHKLKQGDVLDIKYLRNQTTDFKQNKNNLLYISFF
jgi:uncharacterized protein